MQAPPLPYTFRAHFAVGEIERPYLATDNMNWDFVDRVLRSKSVRTTYLYGPPGIGKTYAAYNTHRTKKKEEIFACTLTEETTSAELRGHFVPKGGEFVWHDGPFTAAMRHGKRLIINELSHASDDVQHILYPVLESYETARLTLPTKETVVPAKGFQVICTDNVAPDHLTEALRDRFDVIINIKEAHPDALLAIDSMLRPHAEKTVNLTNKRKVSIRQWLAIGRLMNDDFSLEEACVATLGSRGLDIHDSITMANKS